MNEIISSILSAEQKSDEIIKSSNEKARAIILQGENDAESIRNTAITSTRLKRTKILSDAEKKANLEYEKVVEEGEVEIRKVINEALPKVDKVSDYILSEIIK